MQPNSPAKTTETAHGRHWSGPLVGRAVRGRALRIAITVSGVAVSTLLVLVLAAVHRSVTVGVESYVGQPRADLWAAPLGSDNLIRSSGMMPMAAVSALRNVEGVRATDPLLRAFVSAASERSPRPLTLLAIGYRGPDGLGAPPSVVVGRRPEGEDEVTIDRAAAHRLHVGVGDSVMLNGRSFAVVGLSSGTNLLATQFVFLVSTSAEQVAGVVDQVSFVGIELADGADPATVKRRIEARFVTVQVFERAKWVKNNVGEVAAGFLPLLVLVAIVGAVSATLLVALLVQGAVEDRRRDIAILLALGTPASVVGGSVVLHAESLVLSGGLLGGALTIGLQAFLRVNTPMVELAPRATDIVWVMISFGFASLVATLIQLQRLRSIDPVEAFRP